MAAYKLRTKESPVRQPRMSPAQCRLLQDVRDKGYVLLRGATMGCYDACDANGWVRGNPEGKKFDRWGYACHLTDAGRQALDKWEPRHGKRWPPLDMGRPL